MESILKNQLEEMTPTSFCIGVAGYPEKHSEAPNRLTDLEHLKYKSRMGASYIVTQMFLTTQILRFREECKAAGITVPIIPIKLYRRSMI